MEQMAITAKVQIVVADADKVLLDETMAVYCDACNYVSEYVFRTHDLKQFSLNKTLYFMLREKLGLKSQMTQPVIKTVIARYKTILENQKEWIKPSFKKPQYDLVWNRNYSLTQNCFSVNTLNGRVKLLYFAEGMSKYFDHTIYKFGTAKLMNKHGKYYLHISATYEVEESNLSDICNVVGIDRGISFVVATYDSKHKSGFVSGKAIKQKRANYSKLRKEFQMRQTPSSRQRIKAIGQRENRWMQDIHLFACKNCGYKSNDDRIGAMMSTYTSGSIYFLDIFYLFGVNHIAMIYLVIGVIGLFISIIEIYRRSK